MATRRVIRRRRRPGRRSGSTRSQASARFSGGVAHTLRECPSTPGITGPSSDGSRVRHHRTLVSQLPRSGTDSTLVRVAYVRATARPRLARVAGVMCAGWATVRPCRSWTAARPFNRIPWARSWSLGCWPQPAGGAAWGRRHHWGPSPTRARGRWREPSCFALSATFVWLACSGGGRHEVRPVGPAALHAPGPGAGCEHRRHRLDRLAGHPPGWHASMT